MATSPTGTIEAGHRARRAVLGDGLRRHAQRIGDTEAIVTVGAGGADRRAITYRELDARANRVAHALAGLGAAPADVVAVLARNAIETLEVFWGATKLGVAVTGVNFTFTGRELRHQLGHSGARIVVVAEEFVPLVADLRDDLGGVEHWVVLADPAAAGSAAAGWQALEGLLAAAPDTEPDVALHEDDVALIPYTSGTTALPKAVMLSHRNYVASTIPAYAAGLGMAEGDRFYYVMPFHTMAGMGTQITLLSLGATVVLPPPLPPAAALELLESERITIMGQTPAFYLQLTQADGFAGADLSALQRCVVYGGTMPQAMFDAFASVTDDLHWITLWSQSELSQTPTVGRFRSLADVPDGDPAWIGRPTAQLEVRVVDEDGRDADEGELLCRSPGLMRGYLGDPERTAAALHDGWLRTGDLVRQGPGGDLFFVDRRNDVIKTGGMNVSSVEVERVLYGHPGVLEVAVVGLSDPYWSQAVTAFVVPRPGAAPEPDDLVAHARGDLAGYKVPKEVRLVEALPKDAQGKILKRELRATAERAAEDAAPA
jgi:acyl-CoA synthetase (AMP-forming)/AMP-acid ligase II